MSNKKDEQIYAEKDRESMGDYDLPDPTKFLTGEAAELTTLTSQWGQAFIELPNTRGAKQNVLVRGVHFREFIDDRHFEVFNRPLSPSTSPKPTSSTPSETTLVPPPSPSSTSCKTANPGPAPSPTSPSNYRTPSPPPTTTSPAGSENPNTTSNGPT